MKYSQPSHFSVNSLWSGSSRPLTTPKDAHLVEWKFYNPMVVGVLCVTPMEGLDWWHVQCVSHLLPKRQLGHTPSPPPHCDPAHESAEVVTDGWTSHFLSSHLSHICPIAKPYFFLLHSLTREITLQSNSNLPGMSLIMYKICFVHCWG